ncbi:MAG TPA: bifunctional UDP-N-acetylglucosamine diphosphorylase/glucosamine-1-phosphate N-acetyltransferase GlmU [Fastidiosipila sp.]|nr:bifunctional UDP-N-acetylglucosamine diphosphorylase/glucosamine-1-phosphate N-acetyltransferase GlmU [Fastidiosipila sp.]
MEICAIVMAAAEDERMQTKHTKVILQAAGRPVVAWVKRALDGAGITDQVYVVGYRQEQVRQLLGEDVVFVLQEKALGTGHAVMQAESFLNGREGACIIVSGDAPLIRSETLTKLIETFEEKRPALLLLTATTDEPAGYGRIVRDEGGQIEKIVEEDEAGIGELGIGEINAGIYCFDTVRLREALDKIAVRPGKERYLLTDVIEILRSGGHTVSTMPVDTAEIQSVNTRQELEWASRALSRRNIARLMAQGVSIINPESTLIECDVEVGKDTVILPNCALRGKTIIGADCTIGPDVRTKSGRIGNNCKVDQTRLEYSEIGDDCRVGPFVSIKENTKIAEGVTIDSFVEIRRTTIGTDSKIYNHAFISDATLGVDCTVGANVVFARQDAEEPAEIEIGDHVYIGSNSTLVAPLTLGTNTMVAAGSVVTESVPDNALAIGRSRIEIKEDWMRRPR